MKSIDGRNNVKIYNLSSGKSIPDWLTERRRRQLSKRDVEIRRRIELIQDFSMPDVSSCIRVSPDGRYILATGTYKPRVKCFEVAALSLKFERCLDADVVAFDVLSEDYSKLVFLQEDRYVELHSQAGRWFRTRIPKFGRALAYHYPSCDLYLANSGSEIYRLNLNQGRFLNSLQTDAPGINKCVFNKVHYLLTCGTEDGRIEAWDPRSRQRAGVLDCAMHMTSENIDLFGFKSVKQLGITALAYNDALTLGVGTQTGQVLLYDLRSDKPLLVKDHLDGFPIRDVEFHNTSRMVLSMSSKMVKVWEKETGKPHTSIESEVDFNNLCVVPKSGMMFIACEERKIQTYFIPSLGPAPRWCSHLDALTEELEEEEAPAMYDDFKFVTEEELHQLGLQDLVGTKMLRAVMHGYYMDVRLYNKAKLIANPFDAEDFKRRNIRAKISKETDRSIQTKKLPKINRDLYERLVEETKTDTMETKKKKQQVAASAAASLLNDDRFGGLFNSADFEIDQEADEFKLVNPVLSRIDKKKQRQKLQEAEEELEYLRQRDVAAANDSSDSDSIISMVGDSDDDEKVKVSPPKKIQKPKKKRKEAFVQEIPKEPMKGEVNFRAADTLQDLRQNSKKLSKMSLADRLATEMDGKDLDVQHRAFGNREITFTINTNPKLDKLRKQQQEHHSERRKVRRSAAKLKGNMKDKDPFA